MRVDTTALILLSLAAIFASGFNAWRLMNVKETNWRHTDDADLIQSSLGPDQRDAAAAPTEPSRKYGIRCKSFFYYRRQRRHTL